MDSGKGIRRFQSNTYLEPGASKVVLVVKNLPANAGNMKDSVSISALALGFLDLGDWLFPSPF